MNHYIGRFAPSPSGPLHQGSLVAALASWLDARAHHGRWLVRIEDVDTTRTVPGAAAAILRTLEAFGLFWDGPVLVQSERFGRYAECLERLQHSGKAYACACSRKELAQSGAYLGTCRNGMPAGKPARAWRFRLADRSSPASDNILVQDRWYGGYEETTQELCGDFVLKRADGLWAYQLAVVVDDADQSISHVVRGADLLDSTGRQVHLQRALGFATPRYMHVPLVVNARGEKLSKQTRAPALDANAPLPQLHACAQHLGLVSEELRQVTSLEEFLKAATTLWARLHSDSGFSGSAQ